jgi:anti-sigma regulatory factor (Ser/Thr protein kinase)
VTAETGFYTIRFGADPVQLAFFRSGLDRWLQALQWPEDDRVDVILAVSEACTNAVKHAYRGGALGDVDVVARLVLGPGERRVAIRVRDWGAWRPDPHDGGFGLTTMKACMEKVTIKRDDGGTVVALTSMPVPHVVAEPEARAVGAE